MKASESCCITAVGPHTVAWPLGHYRWGYDGTLEPLSGQMAVDRLMVCLLPRLMRNTLSIVVLRSDPWNPRRGCHDGWGLLVAYPEFGHNIDVLPALSMR